MSSAEIVKLLFGNLNSGIGDSHFRGNEEIILVPILRAGLGLMPGFCSIFPDAKVSHIGIYRDEETLKPVRYYFRFPRLKNKKNAAVFILDPMLATGGSINYTLAELKK